MNESISSDSVGQSADLRTRIIAAIAKADQDWCSDNPLHEDMADAVIRDLGLRQQVAGPDGIAYGKHRFVTDWITNE